MWNPTTGLARGVTAIVCSGRNADSIAYATIAVALTMLVGTSLVATPHRAFAETVTVVGTAGTPGTNGAPDVAGTPGGDGQPALATAAVAGDAQNTATATGGNGGVGGMGGAATLPMTVGAAGGDGGNGGDAEAQAEMPSQASGSVTATARATGGAGGAGGGGGRSSTGTLPTFGPRGAGGSGGDALAVVTAVDPVATRTTSDVDAIGGAAASSSNVGAAGGDATARLDHRTTNGGSHTFDIDAVAGLGFNDPSDPNARGGSALGELVVRGDETSSYSGTVSATGGASSGASGLGPIVNPGGRAEVIADVEAGLASVRQDAKGGSNPADGAEAGAAIVQGTVRTSGPFQLQLISTAVGGSGRSANAGSMGGRGGEASVDLLGEGAAEDAFIVDGRATGGNGSNGGGNGAATTVGRSSGPGTVQVTSTAYGGDGGPTTAGGDATASATGIGSGSALIVVSASATGGDGGSTAGAATATASGESTGGGDVIVSARQSGGSGRDSQMLDQVSGSTSGRLDLRQYATGGDLGASARSELHATNPGGGDLIALAQATTGLTVLSSTGGDAQAIVSGHDAVGASVHVTADALARKQGNASATAYGESTAGGSVRAEAFQQAGVAASGDDGLDASITDAVGGRTTGQLTLLQQVTAGSGGRASNLVSGGNGGAATSSLDASNPDDGALDATSIAVAGAGAPGTTTEASGAGGTATASGRATDIAGADVALRVSAQGGVGGGTFSIVGVTQDVAQGGAGGNAVVTPVFASSAGGDVSVTAEQIGGDGGDANRGRGGAGADSILIDVVGGGTTGTLSLTQLATAGRGGDSISTERAVDGAAALSSLTRRDAVTVLDATAEARGGDAGRGSATLGQAMGGTADATLDLRNSAGGIEANALAIGGSQSATGSDSNGSATGGAARIDIVAVTERDGDSIAIGTHNVIQGHGAHGGAGGTDTLIGSGISNFAGDGGSGISTSFGEALGDAAVSVRGVAFGGSGGRTRSGENLGSGGDAHTTTIARNAGLSPVWADSSARGGRVGSSSTTVDAFGGDAYSSAQASGLGEVVAHATAEGGTGVRDGYYGSANATAIATSERFALAEVDGSGFGDNLVSATSMLAPLAGPIAHATAGFGGTTTGGRYVNGTTLAHDRASGITVPLITGSDVLVALDTATSAAGGLANLDIDLSTSGDFRGEGDVVTQHAIIDLILAVPVAAGQSLALDFSSASVQGGGFDSLRLVVAFEGVTQIDRFFTDPAAALAFFSSTSLWLGALDSGLTGRLVYELEMISSNTGDGFTALSLLQVIPEPTSGTLILVGLIWMTRIRRGRR